MRTLANASFRVGLAMLCPCLMLAAFDPSLSVGLAGRLYLLLIGSAGLLIAVRNT